MNLDDERYELYLNNFLNWYGKFKDDGHTEKLHPAEDEDERIERIACSAWMKVVETYL